MFLLMKTLDFKRASPNDFSSNNIILTLHFDPPLHITSRQGCVTMTYSSTAAIIVQNAFLAAYRDAKQ